MSSARRAGPTALFIYGETLWPTEQVTLAGSGTATLTLIRRTDPDIDAWVFGSLRYDFAPEAIPTPEASTLLLGATDLVWLVCRARRIATR